MFDSNVNKHGCFIDLTLAEMAEMKCKKPFICTIIEGYNYLSLMYLSCISHVSLMYLSCISHVSLMYLVTIIIIK